MTINKQTAGGLAIGLMWIGFCVMYAGAINAGNQLWGIIGLAVVAGGSLLVLRFW